MLRKIYAWLDSWRETLVIKYRHPELYRQLTAPLDPDDFIEVGPPLDTSHFKALPESTALELVDEFLAHSESAVKRSRPKRLRP